MEVANQDSRELQTQLTESVLVNAVTQLHYSLNKRVFIVKSCIVQRLVGLETSCAGTVQKLVTLREVVTGSEN